MKNLKEIIVPTVVLFVICLVATFLLALTDKVTAPKIETLTAETEKKSRAEVLPDADTFSNAKTLSVDGKQYSYYIGYDENGNIAGYTFTTSAKGYGGDVVLMTGVDTSGTVTGVTTLVLNETAGLGMNAQKESFRNQYIGKSGVIGVSTVGNKAENGIDAMTGATITSRAVTNAVNLALELYANAKEVGGNG
jgi:electron transport complex protein RnfG